ncbi:MaoC/PaaZ C-terminal domain-containing protein [Arcanobacterium hippocoleae]
MAEDLHLAPIVPAALLGLCWPAIYAALGSAQVAGYPVIEGLLNAVHLDHAESLAVAAIPANARISAVSYCADIAESASGRVVTVDTVLRAADWGNTDGNTLVQGGDMFAAGTEIGRFSERFAIRGRASGSDLPAEPRLGREIEAQLRAGKRTLLRKISVKAPRDMTAFAMVSGDYNPIHTSYRAAKVAGLDAPLVHGMWLCAAAQHVVCGADESGVSWHIENWIYRMYGLVNLNDNVDISVERIGIASGGRVVLEVICKVDGEIVSQAAAIASPACTAYVYPGQGIQKAGMTLDERTSSPAVREVWERADAYTRKELDFSILAVVRDNPTALTANGVTYRHPQGC